MTDNLKDLAFAFSEGPGLEVFKFLLNLLLLVITWTFGRGLLSRWEDAQKLREMDLTLRRQLHELYGVFRSNMRLWHQKGESGKWANCPELFEKVVETEGLIEALISDISAMKRLQDDEKAALGLFRQGYQTLRQAMAKGDVKKVPYDYSSQAYHLFIGLMTVVSRISVSSKRQPSLQEAITSIEDVLAVGTEEWDKAVSLVPKAEPWRVDIEKIVKQVVRGREGNA